MRIIIALFVLIGLAACTPPEPITHHPDYMKVTYELQSELKVKKCFFFIFCSEQREPPTIYEIFVHKKWVELSVAIRTNPDGTREFVSISEAYVAITLIDD